MSDAQRTTVICGGRWHGHYGTAPCPICQPEARPGQNALTLSDGSKGLLAHCKKAGCEFRTIMAAIGIAQGGFEPLDPVIIARRDLDRRKNAEKRGIQARKLWNGAGEVSGSVAEIYLYGRGITCDLPDTLRFHPEGWHTTTARRWPAMLARIDGCPLFSIHRTWLCPDGTGKAPIEPAKAMLGSCSGGAVRLSCASDRLVVAEGIETALSLLCGLLDGPATVWAALSTSGLRGLSLPQCQGRLTIAADGDAAGHAAAATLAERAQNLGWRVSIRSAPEGRDWNDVLLGKVVMA